MTAISTSAKLDWLDAMMADHRIDARAKVVAFCIMQHVNRDTGSAFVSDPTIVDKTGIPKTWVNRARKTLRSAGWITWKRTGTANIYSTFTAPMVSVVERQQELRRARESRRREVPPVADQDAPPVAQLEIDEVPPLALHVEPPVAFLEVPPVAHIPRSLNPVVLTPSKKSLAMISNPASDFDRFWSVYPKRVGRLKAASLYAKIIRTKTATVDELLAGAKRYAAERAGQDPKYTAHASTWLNRGSWADEPTVNKPVDSIMTGLAGYLQQENNHGTHHDGHPADPNQATCR